jgi:diacylglycerol kinase family enzyme
MTLFAAQVCSGNGGESARAELSQLLAVRIANFGGLLRQLAPGASLNQEALRLVLFRTSSRLAYLNYVLRGILARDWKVSGIEVRSATEVRCDLLAPAGSDGAGRVLVEADGELLGTLPATISIVPDALTLIYPGPLHQK